jgi:hypothetical protein
LQSPHQHGYMAETEQGFTSEEREGCVPWTRKVTEKRVMGASTTLPHLVIYDRNPLFQLVRFGISQVYLHSSNVQNAHLLYVVLKW